MGDHHGAVAALGALGRQAPGLADQGGEARKGATAHASGEDHMIGEGDIAAGIGDGDMAVGRDLVGALVVIHPVGQHGMLLVRNLDMAGAVAASSTGTVPERPSATVRSWKKKTPKPHAAENRITRAMPPSRPSLR